MGDQDLIDKIDDCIIIEQPVNYKLAKELLDNYKKLIESNAELHKEIAKLRCEKQERIKRLLRIRGSLSEDGKIQHGCSLDYTIYHNHVFIKLVIDEIDKILEMDGTPSIPSDGKAGEGE